MKNPNFIDCFECKHFFVTWDQNNPKGCKAFGFKTAKMPSMVVFETSGERCLKFEAKKSDSNPPTKTPNRGGWTA